MINNIELFKSVFSQKALPGLYNELIESVKSKREFYAETVSGKRIESLGNTNIIIKSVSFSTHGVIKVDFILQTSGVTFYNNNFTTILKYDMKTNRYQPFNTTAKLIEIDINKAYPGSDIYKVPFKIQLNTSMNKLELLLGK